MVLADDARAGLIAADLVVAEGDVLTLQLGTLPDFAERCPEQNAAIVECAAFVNWRRIEMGYRPILTLKLVRWVSHSTQGLVSFARAT